MRPTLLSILSLSTFVLANIVFPKPQIACNPSIIIHGYTECQAGQVCGTEGICLYQSHPKFARAYSSDGKCGVQNGGLLCNPNSKTYKGTCCSKYGWCGNSEAHCNDGCQSGCKRPISPALGSETKDGRCGKAFGNIFCGKWPYGRCCSAAGFCGVTKDHCNPALGCQSGCKSSPPPPGRATSASEPKITHRPGGGSNNGPITTNGQCGVQNNGAVCGDWSQGLPRRCCSMYGFCGTTDDHCGVGCQSGECIGAPISPAPGPAPAHRGLGTFFSVIGQAGVPAMHAALMTNGKVVFLDKVENYSQLRLRNGQYAYSSEFDPNTGQVVPLAYKTNAFCSGGTFLADGRLLNIGGNGPLDFIDPTVTDGFDALRYLQRGFGTASLDGHDWIEPGNKLASKRWYASAQTLPDGRVFVASGSLNGLDPTLATNNNPTYEILSPEGITNGVKVRMGILVKAQPYYMYPFIHTLRDGNLFIFISKFAQIFNVDQNAVVHQLPDLPGGYRTYPNTGTSVLLPLSSSDGYKSHILVCGGGAYQDITSPTDASCGRIIADDPGAQWTLESMPQGRVMVDGLLLADGKVLLVNGANRGAQGFDLADSPTLSPLIYNPDAPRGQRFTEYPGSPIPRLYHSVALLLLDGTVLIAGSNPVEQPILQPNGQHPFVTDFRVERWVPPYLLGENAGRRPRNIRLAAKTLAPGGTYTLEFDVIGDSKSVKVVLYHGGFVTHSVHMGHRMVFLDNSGFQSGTTHQNIRLKIPSRNTAQPGPWVIYVLLDGIPSIGQFVKIQ
ncbi:hypothetical protein AOL_s00079g46 [Orbilia oligospora ATCC 24927]|uniref:Chitin-binding type-1 domain-containing protein n=1 Tax=Arthrobotrys oligospora (strain ATCC 24927 / CBS 115.81 / DSM 1491) TaxID=756982 RepID=G1XCL1_ARTOA|nr:hypothetical protein AOL_s00079g46 [Orbilia oligospora ATCC 24927]EGX49092.1 hypothetical protein AOL_s00079g46 [Orbilia oligospora ATCC 24927]